MSVMIDWGALGLVCVVSFGAAVGVIVLFALGVSALAPVAQPTTGPDRTAPSSPRPAWAWPVAALCSSPAPWWWSSAST
ncbi:MAG: hypothetical protein ACRDS0_17220 [Pseudonocardiaceae bacterium]